MRASGLDIRVEAWLDNRVTSRRVSYSLFIVIAVLMILTHICAAPFHVHAGDIATHDEGHSHRHGSDGADDAIHAGSCDALKTPTIELAAVVLVPVGTMLQAAASPSRRCSEVNASLVGGSPPLFLLHATLLI